MVARCVLSLSAGVCLDRIIWFKDIKLSVNYWTHTIDENHMQITNVQQNITIISSIAQSTIIAWDSNFLPPGIAGTLCLAWLRKTAPTLIRPRYSSCSFNSGIHRSPCTYFCCLRSRLTGPALDSELKRSPSCPPYEAHLESRPPSRHSVSIQDSRILCSNSCEPTSKLHILLSWAVL